MELSKKLFETDIFDYVDQMKDLLSDDLWTNILMDCSKNELFILWLLFRQGEVNMTGVAEYICVPLNTATGIISRMERKELVLRERSPEDKRVVTITLGEKGKQQMQAVMEEIIYYGGKVLDAFEPEETRILFRLLDKLLEVMREKRETKLQKSGVRKITIN